MTSEWSRKRLAEKAKDWQEILGELGEVKGLTSLAINPNDFLIAGHGDNSMLICSKGDCPWDREYPTGEPLRTFLEDMATHTREGHMDDDVKQELREEAERAAQDELEAKEAAEEAAELEEKTCAYSCLADGVNYPECPVHSPVSPKQYPYPDGDVMVLGPELFIDADREVIAYQGQHYQRMTEPQKPDTEAALAQPVNKSFVRQLSMEWAVKLNVVERQDLRNADDGLIGTAQRIYDWMIEQ